MKKRKEANIITTHTHTHTHTTHQMVEANNKKGRNKSYNQLYWHKILNIK